MEHLVIIGNGIAGITTARHVRKRSDIKISIISNESDHFFSRTALMYIYMGHMKYEHTKPYEDWFWEKNRLELIRGYVSEIDTNTKTLQFDDGRTMNYSKLVLATGAKSNKFGWPGQDLPGVQGLYSYQDLELLEENSKGVESAVIVGGGLIGIELGEMLASRNIKTTFLIREEFYWDNILPKEEAQLISRHIVEHGFDLTRETNLKEIVAGSNGRVKSIITEFGQEIPCQLVGLTPGVHPNIDLAKASGLETDRGILVNDYLETTTPDVYACGDCAEIIVEGSQRNRIEQLWYTGRMQGQALAKTICGDQTLYERGIWFNSAKFLDIEYQTYGFVNNVPRDGEDYFYWEHPEGRHCAKIVYQDGSREIIGMNFFGIRMRHEVCERWIQEKRTVEYALEHLQEANFDPEFFRHYEPDIIDSYNRQTGANIPVKRQRRLLSRIFA